MKYGQNYYDFDEGLMTFFAPGQVVTTDINYDRILSGWWLVVHPDFQNRGIAVATMKELEKQIKDMKINTIRLDAYSQNPYALKLYEKLGYVKTGEARWRKGLFYLYEKKI